jgi:protein-S-isoprenylcysteine O-methyltransferase Ste14
VLFTAAGTLNWWGGWVFVGVFLAGSLAASFGLLKANQDLLAECLKPPIQKEQAPVVEERFLGRELPGYPEYTRRLRYRLIPFLW